MLLSAPQDLFGALRSGRSELLPAESGATVVDVTDTQFIRVRKSRGATVLDRVTLGRATVQ